MKASAPHTIAMNKKAWHDYFIEDTFEAGIALEGWEIKSLRAGQCQITDSYILIRKNELFWLGGHITPLLSASTHVHPDPRRTRKLLLHRLEINKLIGKTEQKGFALIPLNCHWHKGRAKLDIALAKGKKLHDKRATEKTKDWAREKQRVMKSYR